MRVLGEGLSDFKKILSSLKGILGGLKGEMYSTLTNGRDSMQKEEIDIMGKKIIILTNRTKKAAIYYDNLEDIREEDFVFDKIELHPVLLKEKIYYKGTVGNKQGMFFVGQDINKDNINDFLMEEMGGLFVDDKGVWVFNNDDNLHYLVGKEINNNGVNKIVDFI